MNLSKAVFGKTFVAFIAAATLCFGLIGCSSSNGQSAASASSSDTVSAEAAASAASESTSAAAAAAGSTSTDSSQAAEADSDEEEIDFSDPTLLTDLDEFQFDAVTVYAPKKFELVEQEDADVAEDDFWRTSSHIGILVNRKPISYYSEKYDSELAQELLSSEEAFQQFMLEGTEIEDTKRNSRTDNINGRYYLYADDLDINKHLVYTILMSDEDTYWIYYVCAEDEKDLYHDIMVQMIDKAKVYPPRNAG